MNRLAVLFAITLLNQIVPTPVAAQEGNTGFDSAVHGFNFENSFHNDFISELDVRTDGLCGGMVYTALDYYLAGVRIPRQDYRPAVNTPLHDYIYERQVHSIADNVDKWIELGVNPLGARNSEFFNWGLQGYNGGRLQELREFLDRGRPVPLGLWHADGYRGGDHQVLAIGYKLGRYRGDLGAHEEDMEIHVYDPNYPNEIQTLKPDPVTQTWYYTGKDRRWLTYFVDRKYRPHTPPNIDTGPAPVEGKVHRLLVEILTGGDDLRGGNDNLDIEVSFFGKPPQRFDNVNNSRRWVDNYAQTVELDLREPVDRRELRSLKLLTRFGGGIGGDNWNVDRVVVKAVEGPHVVELAEVEGTPWVRFTGHRREAEVVLNRAPPPSPGSSANRCHAALQDRIAWDYNGNKHWAEANMNRLCGDVNSDQPARCFDKVMHGGVDWGGGTRWNWQNAINLCQRTLNANRTVICFKRKLADGANWSSAIEACKR